MGEIALNCLKNPVLPFLPFGKLFLQKNGKLHSIFYCRHKCTNKFHAYATKDGLLKYFRKLSLDLRNNLKGTAKRSTRIDFTVGCIVNSFDLFPGAEPEFFEGEIKEINKFFRR